MGGSSWWRNFPHPNPLPQGEGTSDGEGVSGFLLPVGEGTSDGEGVSGFLLPVGEGTSDGEGVSGFLLPLPLGEGWGEGRRALELYRTLHRAIAAGLVRACHDCSEGGLAVAAAEMALAGGHGIELRLADVPQTGDLSDATIAFCESLGRFLVEIAPQDVETFIETMTGLPVAPVGVVTADAVVALIGRSGQAVAAASLAQVSDAWQNQQLSWAERKTPASVDAGVLRSV
ncbi:MAG: AIR synthase-related protein [Caldilineales bacterium]